MSKKIRVFVYGTLKRGRGNHRLLDQDGVEFLGRSLIKGPHAFVHLGGFPGVVKDALKDPREIGGEVYEVTNDVLLSLDMLEGHPTFYERQKVSTKFGKAWIYFLPNREHYTRMQSVETPFWFQTEEEAEWLSEMAA